MNEAATEIRGLKNWAVASTAALIVVAISVLWAAYQTHLRMEEVEAEYNRAIAELESRIELREKDLIRLESALESEQDRIADFERRHGVWMTYIVTLREQLIKHGFQVPPAPNENGEE